jgi:hypothetical protein
VGSQPSFHYIPSGQVSGRAQVPAVGTHHGGDEQLWALLDSSHAAGWGKGSLGLLDNLSSEVVAAGGCGGRVEG